MVAGRKEGVSATLTASSKYHKQRFPVSMNNHTFINTINDLQVTYDLNGNYSNFVTKKLSYMTCTVQIIRPKMRFVCEENVYNLSSIDLPSFQTCKLEICKMKFVDYII